MVLPPNYEPSKYCVICGRGRECFDSVGNRRFRVIVNIFLERYAVAAKKSEKSQLVSEVVDIIHKSGGRFVKFESNSWSEVSESIAREKVGSLFRDCLHERYRSSGKSKTARRRARQLSKRAQQPQREYSDGEDSCSGLSSSGHDRTSVVDHSWQNDVERQEQDNRAQNEAGQNKDGSSVSSFYYQHQDTSHANLRQDWTAANLQLTSEIYSA